MMTNPTLRGMRAFLRAAIESFRTGERPRVVEVLPPLRSRPYRREPKNRMAERAAEVMKVLESAPSGLTYDELQEHVRQVTGTACSRKVVARWKKEQSNSSVSSHQSAA